MIKKRTTNENVFANWKLNSKHWHNQRRKCWEGRGESDEGEPGYIMTTVSHCLIFSLFFRIQPEIPLLLTSDWPLLLTSNLNPNPDPWPLSQSEGSRGEALMNSCKNKKQQHTFKLKPCVLQLSCSSCCGASTSATPCAPYPQPSTSRATWRRPSTMSSSAPPSSTSSGGPRTVLFVLLSMAKKELWQNAYLSV